MQNSELHKIYTCVFKVEMFFHSYQSGIGSVGAIYFFLTLFNVLCGAGQ